MFLCVHIINSGYETTRNNKNDPHDHVVILAIKLSIPLFPILLTSPFFSTLDNFAKRKMSLKFFDKLSQNFIELLNDKNDYNVIIQVENEEKTLTAHSNVLKFRSSYFCKELENIQPNENNIKIMIKSSISAQIFDFIL